jgi:hypothetical protein
MGGFPTWRVVSWHDVNQAVYNRPLVNLFGYFVYDTVF